jgi:signal transduction histidine kinase
VSKKIDLVTTISDTVPEILYLDFGRLEQVLINLLSNAVKFTSNGKIETNINFDQFSHKLIVKVSDTGFGISKED